MCSRHYCLAAMTKNLESKATRNKEIFQIYLDHIDTFFIRNGEGICESNSHNNSHFRQQG